MNCYRIETYRVQWWIEVLFVFWWQKSSHVEETVGNFYSFCTKKGVKNPQSIMVWGGMGCRRGQTVVLTRYECKSEKIFPHSWEFHDTNSSSSFPWVEWLHIYTDKSHKEWFKITELWCFHGQRIVQTWIQLRTFGTFQNVIYPAENQQIYGSWKTVK